MIRVKIKKIQTVSKCSGCLYKLAVDKTLNEQLNSAILQGDIEKMVDIAVAMRTLKETEGERDDA